MKPLESPQMPRPAGASDPIIAVSGLSKTYASGFQALKTVDLTIRRGEIFALLGPNGAGKTTLISIICGIVNPSTGHGHRRRPRHRARLPRRAHEDRSRAAGADHRRLRERMGDRDLQPGPLRQAAEPRLSREDPEGPLPVGKARQQDHDALRRHEAPGDDRQGPVARAQYPLPRRAHRRRRRGAAAGHVEHGARVCARTASPSS